MKPVLIIAIVFSITIALVGVVAMTNTVDDTSAAEARAEAAAYKAVADKAVADKAAAYKAAVAKATDKAVEARAAAYKAAEARAAVDKVIEERATDQKALTAGLAADARAAAYKIAYEYEIENYVDCRENPNKSYYECQQIKQGAHKTAEARAETEIIQNAEQKTFMDKAAAYKAPALPTHNISIEQEEYQSPADKAAADKAAADKAAAYKSLNPDQKAFMEKGPFWKDEGYQSAADKAAEARAAVLADAAVENEIVENEIVENEILQYDPRDNTPYVPQQPPHWSSQSPPLLPPHSYNAPQVPNLFLGERYGSMPAYNTPSPSNPFYP